VSPQLICLRLWLRFFAFLTGKRSNQLNSENVWEYSKQGSPMWLQSHSLLGLQELDVSSNHLTSLAGIGGLPGLRSLKASNNAITVSLPPSERCIIRKSACLIRCLQWGWCVCAGGGWGVWMGGGGETSHHASQRALTCASSDAS